MSVPTTLHMIWLGPRPVPDQWIAAWRAMHPSWEHLLWREADLAGLPMTDRARFDDFLARGIWHGAADIARLEILLAHGGVYVDVDSRPLRSFDGAPFMAAGVFAAYEPTPSLPGRVANGTIGAEAGHPVIRTCIDLVAGMETLDPPWDTCGGTALTAALLVHRRCCSPAVLPARTFYPTTAAGKPTPGPERPYCEHFWATTNRRLPLRAVVLVPRRAGDPVRDRVWDWVRARWERQGWPVHEGHHDDGLFNAAAARNAAARLAGDWDVAMFVDADTTPMDFGPVREAVELANSSGRFVRPFTRYLLLDEQASAHLMDTDELPATGIRPLGEPARGGVVVVPRGLWDALGGYDERFRGWGWEDTAFEAAATTLSLGGKGHTLRGEVYHLWHPMQQRDPSTPEYRANVALGRRYLAARRPAAMRALLAERSAPAAPSAEPAPFRVGLLVITNGRRECLERTIASIERHVSPAFADRLIVDDSGSRAYATWLAEAFPGYRIDAHRHLGHGPAVARAFAQAARMHVDWVFVCEDDMEYQQPVDLQAMAREMDANPGLSQMILRRQAWFPTEVEAGGMIERFDSSLFEERSQNGTTWIEHRQFWSISSNLVRRAFLQRHRWPPVPNSEHQFSRRLFRDEGVTAGIWGARSDPPRVLHIGAERAGDGY